MLPFIGIFDLWAKNTLSFNQSKKSAKLNYFSPLNVSKRTNSTFPNKIFVVIKTLCFHMKTNCHLSVIERRTMKILLFCGFHCFTVRFVASDIFNVCGIVIYMFISSSTLCVFCIIRKMPSNIEVFSIILMLGFCNGKKKTFPIKFDF